VSGILITILVFIIVVAGLIRYGTIFVVTEAGVVVKEERIRDLFSHVVFDGVGDVNLTRGETVSVMVSGDENIVMDVVTEVVGDTLTITYKSPLLKLLLSPRAHTTVLVTAPAIESIHLTGVGTISGDMGEVNNVSLVLREIFHLHALRQKLLPPT
jgi:hypothetical protein